VTLIVGRRAVTPDCHKADGDRVRGSKIEREQREAGPATCTAFLARQSQMRAGRRLLVGALGCSKYGFSWMPSAHTAK